MDNENVGQFSITGKVQVADSLLGTLGNWKPGGFKLANAKLILALVAPQDPTLRSAFQKHRTSIAALEQSATDHFFTHNRNPSTSSTANTRSYTEAMFSLRNGRDSKSSALHFRHKLFEKVLLSLRLSRSEEHTSELQSRP